MDPWLAPDREQCVRDRRRGALCTDGLSSAQTQHSQCALNVCIAWVEVLRLERLEWERRGEIRLENRPVNGRVVEARRVPDAREWVPVLRRAFVDEPRNFLGKPARRNNTDCRGVNLRKTIVDRAGG